MLSVLTITNKQHTDPAKGISMDNRLEGETKDRDVYFTPLHKKGDG